MVILAGHSVSATGRARPSNILNDLTCFDLSHGLSSPRYIDDTDYEGGFRRRHQRPSFLAGRKIRLHGFATMAIPVIVGNSDQLWLGQELADSIGKLDPLIANDSPVPRLHPIIVMICQKFPVRTLILQSRDDIIASSRLVPACGDKPREANFVMLNACLRSLPHSDCP
jgi:hypothetical protein